MGLEGVVTTSTQTGSVSMGQGLNSILSSHSMSAFSPCALQVGHTNGPATVRISIKSISYKLSELRTRPNFAGEIWNRIFHSEHSSDVFCSHFARSRTAQLSAPLRINHILIKMSSFSTASVSKCSSSTLKCKAGVCKLVRTNIFKFLRRGVDGP